MELIFDFSDKTAYYLLCCDRQNKLATVTVNGEDKQYRVIDYKWHNEKIKFILEEVV
jgi:hypothetical protein